MKFKGRYFLVMAMFILSLLLYIDRVCISVAKDVIGTDLGLDDRAMGWVLSAFALGYALFQVPSGMLADRFGSRVVLSGIVSIWSMFTAFTGMVNNLSSLLMVRFLFGAGEAGAFPSMSRAIFSWIPLKERGLVLGLNFSGSRLGAAFALPFVAWLITSLGWRTSFLILGAIGIVWAVLWWIGFRNLPENHPRLSEDEKKEILHGRQGTDDEVVEKAPMSKLLKSKNMRIAIVQYFCSNFTFFFALTWLFPYLKETYSLNTMEAGWYTIAQVTCCYRFRACLPRSNRKYFHEHSYRCNTYVEHSHFRGRYDLVTILGSLCGHRQKERWRSIWHHEYGG